MVETLETILKKYQDIEEKLFNPKISVEELKNLSLEKNKLEEIVNEYKKYKIIVQEIETINELLKESDEPFLKEELKQNISLREQIEETLKIMLLPKDERDDKNVILEIRGAAGGEEANLFARDLFEMYSYYASKENWKVEVLNTMESSNGGYTLVEFMIKGEKVYSKLKYESGAHRVQRVPVTESQGRVHTSTATVLVIPEADDIELDIKESDLKIDVYRSSGAGGQSVNTTDSAVRITHLPTGIIVTCQNERSQIKNREKALSLLKAKIYEETVKEQEEQEHQIRKSKIGTGDRSEKIRTYNYPQNRVTDHRINYTNMNLDRIMLGDLTEIIERLIAEDQRRLMETK